MKKTIESAYGVECGIVGEASVMSPSKLQL